MKAVHYINLTRGTMCPHNPVNLPHARYVRLQSTWCEQKLWEQVLWTTDADLFFNLAIGNRCVVHDASERDRETRACWQGLAWIRYACERSWGLPASPPVMRNGHNASAYFGFIYEKMSANTRNYLRYFRQYHQDTPILLESCYAKNPSQVLPRRPIQADLGDRDPHDGDCAAS